MISTTANETVKRRVAIAAASFVLNPPISWLMKTGAVRVLFRMLPGHHHDRAEFAERTSEHQESAAGDTGQDGGQDDLAERRPAGCPEDARRLLFCQIQLEQDRLDRAHDERERDEQQREQDARPFVDHVDAVVGQEPTDRRVRPVQRARASRR